MAEVADKLSPKRAGSRDRVAWLVLPMGVLLGALFLFPLGRLVSNSFITESGVSASRYAELFHDKVFLDVILRTVRISAMVCFLTGVIGYPIAYSAARAPKLLASLILACVTLPLFTSSLVRSYAWRALLADNGVVNEWLVTLGVSDGPVPLIFNDTGILIGMTQILLPFMILPIFASMSGIDRSVISAARSMGASHLTAWRTVFLPQSLKGVASGASLVFVSALGYYTTPALLGGISTPMFAQLVDSQINTQADYGPTTAEAALVLIAVIAMLLLLRRPLGLVTAGNASRSRLRLLPGPAHLKIFRRFVTTLLTDGPLGRFLLRVEEGVSRVRWLLVGAVTFLGTVFLAGPQFVIVMLAFNDSNYLSFPPPAYSTRWFSDYFADNYWLGSTQLSFVVAIAAAALATLIGTLAAFGVVRMKAKRMSVSMYMLGMFPMVVPSIIYAVGLFFIYVQIGLAGTALGLIAAYSVLGIPYVMLTSQAVVRDIDPLLERAAASLGAPIWRRTVTVVLPLMVPAIVASFLLAFIHAFDDLIMGLFLGSAETVTLQMRMFEDIRFEISPKVAAVGVLITFSVLIIGGFMALLNRQRRRILVS